MIITESGFDQDRRWRAGWEGTPMLTVVHNAEEANDSNSDGGGRSLLDEIVRDGARQMLAAALAAEVAAYIDAHAGQVDENGRRQVARTCNQLAWRRRGD